MGDESQVTNTVEPGRQSWTVLVAGRKGGGKSTLMQAIVLAYLRETRTRFVVRDSSPWAEWRAMRGPRLLWLPGWKFSGRDCCQIAMDWSDCVYVDDEADLIYNARQVLVPETPEHTMLHRGRHYGVAMFLAGRSTQNLSIDLRRNADTVFLFRHREPGDLEWIAECCGPEWAEAAKHLPPKQWLRCDL